MKKTVRNLAIIAFASLTFTACSKDVETEENDNELITTIELHVTETGTSTTGVFKFEDLDGDGGAAPVIDAITLSPNKTYNVELKVLDKSKTPAVTISEEILEEGDDHRFYFEPTGASITVNNLSNDANGLPLGLTSTWTTGAASTGKLKITLRHYESGGKALTDPVSSTKSSTDAEVEFNAAIQ